VRRFTGPLFFPATFGSSRVFPPPPPDPTNFSSFWLLFLLFQFPFLPALVGRSPSPFPLFNMRKTVTAFSLDLSFYFPLGFEISFSWSWNFYVLYSLRDSQFLLLFSLLSVHVSSGFLYPASIWQDYKERFQEETICYLLGLPPFSFESVEAFFTVRRLRAILKRTACFMGVGVELPYFSSILGGSNRASSD